MSYADLQPSDLMTMVRDGDPAALEYLNALPTHKMLATVRTKPWRPILIKAQTLKDFNPDQPRDADGRFGEGGGGRAPIQGIGGSGSGTAITHIEVGQSREAHPGENHSAIAHFPTGTGDAPRPGMGDTAIGAKQLQEMRESPVTGQYLTKDGTFTPERQALHDDIVRQAVSNAPAQDNPKVVMVGGGSASGKSSSLEQGLIDTPKDAARVDSDEMARQLPEAKEMIAAGDKNWGSQTHEEGAYLAGRVLAAAQEKQANVVLDGGRATRMGEKIDAAHAAGYQVEGHIITRDPAAAQAEVASRPAGESKAPPEVIAQRYSELSKTIPEIAPKFDSLTVHENTGTDAHPELHPIAEVHNGVLTVSDNAAYNRFLSNGTSKRRKKRTVKYSEDQPRDADGRFGSGGGDKETGEPHPQVEESRAAGATTATMTAPGPTVAEVAASTRNEAIEARPAATAALRNAIPGAGGKVLGDPGPPGEPSHSVKTQDSLERKIADKQAAGEQLTGVRPPADEAAKQITDALRYTGVADKATYADMIKGTAQAMVDQGFTFSRVKNTWDDYGAKAYRGVNTSVTTPEGHVFELQFHTPESFATKDDDQHPLYEEWRLPTTTDDRKAELHDQMMGMANSLGSSPPGIAGIDQAYFDNLKPRS